MWAAQLGHLKTGFLMIMRNIRVDWFAQDAWRTKRLQEEHDWQLSGRVGPTPPRVKEVAVREAAQASGFRTLVETGTFAGDMVAAVAGDFEHIYSVELSRLLYVVAKLRFIGRRRIRIVQGDSSYKLRDVLGQLSEPCVFWLDGHDSGGITAIGEKGCPIVEELSAILSHHVRTHVILIDDARMFEGDPVDVPSLAGLESLIRASRPSSRFFVVDDVVHVTLSG